MTLLPSTRHHRNSPNFKPTPVFTMMMSNTKLAWHHEFGPRTRFWKSHGRRARTRGAGTRTSIGFRYDNFRLYFYASNGQSLCCRSRATWAWQAYQSTCTSASSLLFCVSIPSLKLFSQLLPDLRARRMTELKSLELFTTHLRPYKQAKDQTLNKDLMLPYRCQLS